MTEEPADPYAVLGVDRDASDDAIRSAYRRLARKYHPDLYIWASSDEQIEAAERMRAINDAWEVLGSAAARRRYDEATRPDPMRLVAIEAVLGPGFALKTWTSGGMTAGSWGGARVNPVHPGTWAGVRPQQWLITAWARDLSPLRKLYREEIPALWVVNGAETGDEAMEHIAALSWLEVLDLRDTAVTTLGVARLAGFDHLWCLNLNGTQINDKAVETIATLPSLVELGLAETAVTDACVSDLLRLQNLTVLNLARTKISASAIRELAELPNLQILRAPGRVPFRTLLWARRHRPNLAIT